MAALIIKRLPVFCLLCFASIPCHSYAQTINIINAKRTYHPKDKVLVTIKNNNKEAIHYYVSLLIQDNGIDASRVEWRELIQDIRHDNIAERKVVMKNIKPGVTDTLAVRFRHFTRIQMPLDKNQRFKLTYFTGAHTDIKEMYTPAFRLKN